MPRSPNRGFTLVELLVVISIVGLLVALLLPAVMRAREAARRTSCKNNLKQLGVALHHFHDSYRRFPAGTENEWSWQVRLLPFLEQNSLYDRLDMGREPFESPNDVHADYVLSVLNCPSDGWGDHVHTSTLIPGMDFAHTNFLGSLDGENGQSRGMFEEYGSVRLSEVTDGTSQTLFVGERGVVESDGQTHGWWVWGPETVTSDRFGFQPGSFAEPESADHWWSYHPGGAQFLFVDGSVQFLPYGISSQTFRGLSTKDGGEPVASLTAF